jgi:DNA-binding NarL/FixJ family response regulator
MGSELVGTSPRSEPRKARAPSGEKLWQDIASGRLVVVRHQDENGRRYLHVQAPRDRRDADALSEREHQVVSHRVDGQGLKRIAAELGVSVPTVTRCLARALRKLGLRSEMDLPAVFGAGLRDRFRKPPGLRVERALPEGDKLVISFRIATADWQKQLTRTEVEVARQVLAGLSNADIALRRDTAVRTIANQVASIYRKLRVRSRLELSLYTLAGQHALEGRPPR